MLWILQMPSNLLKVLLCSDKDQFRYLLPHFGDILFIAECLEGEGGGWILAVCSGSWGHRGKGYRDNHQFTPAKLVDCGEDFILILRILFLSCPLFKRLAQSEHERERCRWWKWECRFYTWISNSPILPFLFFPFQSLCYILVALIAINCDIFWLVHAAIFSWFSSQHECTDAIYVTPRCKLNIFSLLSVFVYGMHSCGNSVDFIWKRTVKENYAHSKCKNSIDNLSLAVPYLSPLHKIRKIIFMHFHCDA